MAEVQVRTTEAAAVQAHAAAQVHTTEAAVQVHTPVAVPIPEVQATHREVTPEAPDTHPAAAAPHHRGVKK